MRRWFLLAAAIAILSGPTYGDAQDKAVAPTIWFAPLDPLPRHRPNGKILSGSPQFMHLFRTDAPWPEASRHVRVFQFYPQFIFLPGNEPDGATPAELKQAFTDLRTRGIAISMEHSGLAATDQCGQDVEGMKAADFPERVARIKAAGGTLDYLQMDEPLTYGSYYRGRHACRWSVEQVAEKLRNFVMQAQKAFPGVKVGDVEVLRGYAPPNKPAVVITAAQLEAWLETYKRVVGSYPAFFHLDVVWNMTREWAKDAKELEAYCKARGIAFGLIYNGMSHASTDEKWLSQARAHFHQYEDGAGGRPDDAVFQSWAPRPKALLPESDPDSFTHMINEYAQRKR